MPKPEYILGISAFYHDSAACLLKDGEIIAAAQEERFSRRKHDHSFPEQAIEYCMNHGNITPDRISHIAFYDKPWIKFERLLETYLAFAPSGLFSFLKAMPVWLKEKLWISDIIEDSVGPEGELVYPEHHQSHAASAFYPSPFEKAAILTIDGVGEWATASWGIGDGHNLELQSELRFPHSLGLLYSAFTYYTGFRVNFGEYKVMGLAPYGEPRYVDTILNNLMDLREDGSFRLDLDYFNYCQGLTMTSRKFDKLFGGPPRSPGSELTQREMDLARSVQEVTEEVMMRMARHVSRKTGLRKLCLAGGVALNCVSNGKLLRSNLFDDIWIQPAAGDAGGSVGAAMYTWHQVLGNKRHLESGQDKQKGSFLGPSFSSAGIKAWLNRNDIDYDWIEDEEQWAHQVAKEIAAGKVIGNFQGRMEFGPRALGNRSIMGDARNSGMQSRMNLKIKYRESFRPFAPGCLYERVDDYFEMSYPSPYMLLVAHVKEERRKTLSKEEEELFGIEKLKMDRSDIPAITHIDYSARVQTVHQETNRRYYKLLKAFEALTGYGILINTSFNVRGEPIVCTPQDAYRCFMRTEMDVLVLGNAILYKQKQPAYKEEQKQWRETIPLD